jgi:hypothetical protein
MNFVDYFKIFGIDKWATPQDKVIAHQNKFRPYE